MCPKAMERRYSLNVRPEESFSLVQKALAELNLKDLKIKKSVPSSYILVEYKAGWLDKRQIEFTFKDEQTKTEVSIRWFYPSYEILESMAKKKEEIALVKAGEETEKHKIERLFEELKSRIGATDISAVKEEREVKETEIIREKEVSVKVRCPYCHNLYDETLDKCPHCGAKR